MPDSPFSEYFHALTENSEEPHFLLTLKGVIVAANRSAAALLQRDKAALNNSPLTAFLEDAGATVEDYLKKCSRTSDPVPVKLTWLRKNGEPSRLRSFGHRLSLQSRTEEKYLLLRTEPEDRSRDRFLALNRTLEELRASKNKLIAESKMLEEEIAAHHQTEKALELSYSGLKAILDSLEAIVYVADMETYEIIFINRFTRDIFGEVTGGLCWRNLQVGQTGPCDFCTNKYLLDQEGRPGPAYTWEFRNTHSDRWYYIQDKAIEWVDGRMVRVEIATDITQRKQLEASLKINEERLQALWRLNQLKNISEQELADYALEEAVRLTNSEGGYFHYYDEKTQEIQLSSWSRRVLEVCESARGSHYPLDNTGIWADSIRRSRPVIHNDYQHIPERKGYPEGHFRIIRHMGVPVIDQGKIVAVAGVANKNTPYDQSDTRQLSLFMNSIWSILKQKQTELEVLQAKEEWESTFDALDDVVTLHDRNMRVIRANRAAGRLFDKDPEQLIGRYCYEVFRGTSEPCRDCPEILALKHLKTYRASIHHDNIGKTFEVSSSPIKNDKGQLSGTIHIAKDITEQKKLEEQLRQSQKMEAIGTLAGGIAHDFNNILAPVLGYADLALEQVSPDSQLFSEINQIVKAANRAKELVKQILTFSRQAGQERKPLEPHIFIKETLKLLRHSLPSTIEIRQNLPEDCGTILCDPTQLQQIIMNLCTNAYHAMRQSGGILAVNLSVTKIDGPESKVIDSEIKAGNYVKLEISDTGHGMDRKTMEKAFEPYFTTKPKGEGTGLGLAVVHGLVKNNEGYITVYSEPGRGTTFHIYFPRSLKTAGSAESTRRSSIPGGRERIMVLDDEEAVAELEKAMLSGLGYKVSAYTDCEQALADFRKHPENFDLVITDMTMPKITGLQVTYEVHTVRPEIPVILCTGFSELINEEKAREAGIRKYLMKPVGKKDLAAAVRQALDNGD